MKPIRVRRSSVSSLSDMSLTRASPMKTSPSVSVSRPAIVCMSVDLPEPEGPMMAVNSPAANSTSTERSAATCASPLPYSFVTPTARATV
ncbi:hypothetical protein SGRI78S_04638 [Streptomyces griseus subsp. griseus]